VIGYVYMQFHVLAECSIHFALFTCMLVHYRQNVTNARHAWGHAICVNMTIDEANFYCLEARLSEHIIII